MVVVAFLLSNFSQIAFCVNTNWIQKKMVCKEKIRMNLVLLERHLNSNGLRIINNEIDVRSRIKQKAFNEGNNVWVHRNGVGNYYTKPYVAWIKECVRNAIIRKQMKHMLPNWRQFIHKHSWELFRCGTQTQ